MQGLLCRGCQYFLPCKSIVAEQSFRQMESNIHLQGCLGYLYSFTWRFMLLLSKKMWTWTSKVIFMKISNIFLVLVCSGFGFDPRFHDSELQYLYTVQYLICTSYCNVIWIDEWEIAIRIRTSIQVTVDMLLGNASGQTPSPRVGQGPPKLWICVVVV